MLMPTMAGEAMALATGAMVDMVWDTPDMVWDMLVPMDMDTEATTLARERLRLSQRPNPRLMLMPGMVHTVLDTPDSMVDTVWDTLPVPMDTAVLDTAATTSARERPRLSQRLMLMPTTDMGLDMDTVWDTAPMDILVMLDMDMEATDMDVDTATGVEREVICYERSRLTDY